MFFFFKKAKLFRDFFFFSSRSRHTILTCDWSSDVCSSDLLFLETPACAPGGLLSPLQGGRIARAWLEQRFPPRLEDLRRDVTADGLKQRLFGRAIGRPSQIPQTAVVRDQDAPFVQPAFGKLDQTVNSDGFVGFASHLYCQRALTPLGKRTTAEAFGGPCLMFVSRRAAAIQRAKRGGFRCDDLQFGTEIPQHRDGQRIAGVQRTPGPS